MRPKYPYLNIGCGAKWHSAWINADVQPGSPDVIKLNAGCRLPFSDQSFEVVYSSAMLEHLARSEVKSFLAECYRVLCPRGIIRIGVPDMEAACRTYLGALDKAMEGDVVQAANHEWMMIELIDQVARDASGGEMASMLARRELPNEEFIFSRIGHDGVVIREALLNHKQVNLPARTSYLQRIKSFLLKRLYGADAQKALDIGTFRISGEVHRWAYDRFSIKRLLLDSCFEDVRIVDAITSRIPDWTGFNLDTTPDGVVYKPDLMFVEAAKPA